MAGIEFDEDAVERVRYLQQLFQAGLSSDAIRAVLPCLDTPSMVASDDAFERLIRERDAIRTRFDELGKTLCALDALIAHNRARRPH